MLDDHLVNRHKAQLGDTYFKEDDILVNSIILTPNQDYYYLWKKEIKCYSKLFVWDGKLALGFNQTNKQQSQKLKEKYVGAKAYKL